MTRTYLDHEPQLCEWFALCRRPAAGVVAHPIIGDVPTCADCAAKHELELVQP